MTKVIRVPSGILTLVESKAECPHCQIKISFEEIEPKWMKSKTGFLKMKCKCGKRIGITSNLHGDFVAYEL